MIAKVDGAETQWWAMKKEPRDAKCEGYELRRRLSKVNDKIVTKEGQTAALRNSAVAIQRERVS
jgi:hypothetical protein